MIRYLLPIAALGLLAACGDDPAPSPDDDARTALARVTRLADHTLPELRKQIEYVARVTGLVEATTANQWGEQLAMLGGMLIGLMETWLGATAYSTYRDAMAFAVLILILLVRPAGIMGTAGTEKV